MKKKIKLSVVLATFNEESNIADCIESVKSIADEIIIVDGTSKDNTREIAKKMGARVYIEKNHPIFHINKQIALDKAKGEWILQMDADERVSSELATEIKQVIKMSDKDLVNYQKKILKNKLFIKHQENIEKRDGKIGSVGANYVAFFIPRLNLFLGKYLKYGGVYPDGVIRLVRRGYASFPQKSVHEQITVQGTVGWLQHDLIHIDSPTFSRYLQRNNRYIDLISKELSVANVGKNPFEFINFFVLKPLYWFILTMFRHKGILDGFPGFVFSLFSSLRFPRAYWRYINNYD